MAATLTQNATSNFLVPSNGTTHAVQVNFVASAAPTTINWKQFSIDQFKFNPQGIYVDNSAGTAQLILTSQNTGFTLRIPAGQYVALPFPATVDDIWTATGVGTCNSFWVDYPVFPWTYQGSTSSVTIAGPNPVPVSIPVSVAGAAYQVQQTPTAATLLTNTLTTGSSSTAAPANTNIRKLQLTITGEAILGVGGDETITVTLNGVTIFVDTVYIPSVAAQSGKLYDKLIDFDGVAFASAGNFVVTLGTTLTAGLCRFDAWFA